ncbi:hypothetical protein HN371_21995 [Candidatus Poribacteria bacterium]|nr:hypothetical protein [Candidatus Poribacteria bacterium]MBT5714126.1 hypothetical protein [Candidatus Poribacteria bacterium]MBT7097594.1 hypothetical protein [Candidatus Poribacteria bacterium]MBT7804801.1 hypothetical protein [Candidatus Poribacteria bacterium]
MMSLTVGLVACACLVAVTSSAGAAEGVAAPALRTVPIPGDADVAETRVARAQPTEPGNYTEVPFDETAPAPVFTAVEQERGYILFQRRIMDPVYPNTRPLAHERLEGLTAFATPGEFEPVTFSIYPTRDLRNLRVRVSSLVSDGDEIPASDVTVRLATYWDVGYPRYTSRDTYRRTPELLERVTSHSSPAGECQRWWITARVPEDAAPGLYRGTVTVWDDGYDRAVGIPIALRVLGFPLLSDPAKHYSVYYYTRNRVQFADKDEDFVRRATANEHKAMVDLGIDMCPTLNLRVDEEGRVTVQDSDELGEMLAAGMTGPIPVMGGNVIAALYRETTPDGTRGSHWKIDAMPPPEFYERVTKAFRGLDELRREKGWPELICCPLDEVDASRKDFGAGVYQAVRDAGIRTYITKDPTALDALAYRDAVDIWCSQPYSARYEKIVAQDRYEYWCYPNHNAGEIKDRRVMSLGGRMTYGFGFWRSGYTTLIPWHWAWTPAPDQFDYLRGSRSGCGQRIGDDGEVIPAVYWESFREGRDDARYIYTLQQAAWEREGSTDADCLRLVAEAKAVLQQMWDDIDVQQKYLADGMWPSEEFNSRRWRLAGLIEALLRFPASRTGTAPSVLVTDTDPVASEGGMQFIADALEQGLLESKELGGDWSEWANETGEGATSVTADAGRDGNVGLRWDVTIDHKTDRGEGGDYPIGWPRVRRAFAEDELDMTAYDYLLYWVRVDSDRDEVADDSTPVGFTINTGGFFEESRDLGGDQNVWTPILFPIRSMIEKTGRGDAPWRSVRRVQMYISEADYPDGAHLTFDIAEVTLLRFKAPIMYRVDAPRFVMLPRSVLPVGLETMGVAAQEDGAYTVEVTLVDDSGRVRVETVKDIATADTALLDTAGLEPGAYTLRVTIMAPDGTRHGTLERPVELMAGPLLSG